MQHSVRELRAIGIQPDILLCRTDRYLSPDIKAKLALYCDVPEEAVITAKDVDIDLRGAARPLGRGPRRDRPEAAWGWTSRGRDMARVGAAGPPHQEPEGRGHRSASSASTSPSRTPTRASTRRSPTAASATTCGWCAAGSSPRSWRPATPRRQAGGRRRHPGARRLRHAAAPAAWWRPPSYARRTGTPYFGICYGFQWAVTEYARNVCGLGSANSTGGGPDAEHKVVYKLQDLLGVERAGRHDAPGLLRLRAAARLARGAAIYGATRDPRAPPPPLRVQPASTRAA